MQAADEVRGGVLLVPWAVQPLVGSGLFHREHSASPPGGEAGAFQQDRERVVGSRAFRRLAGKTQVFTRRSVEDGLSREPGLSRDHFRSRLTHTIEVTQIARDIARRLRLNEELTETLALVHDIGHPPFGHAGEQALDECLGPHGLGFDHNLHALRICEHFEQRRAAHRGLDLTLAVREGIVKHSRDYTAAEHPELGAYFLGERPPLEAQVIDLADEIAYLVADLDDGVESGLLEVARLRNDVELVTESYADVLARFAGSEERFLWHESLLRMARVMADDLVATTDRRLHAGGIATLSDVRRYPERLLRLSAGRERQRREVKRYLHERLYGSPELEREHAEAEQVVRRLFEFWMRSPKSLPAGYVGEIATEGLPRVVADYIAGMTDAFIVQQYEAVRERTQGAV